MRLKRKIIVLLIVIVVLIVLQFALPGHPHMVMLYDRFIFYPYQAVRNFLFGWMPFSVGDVVYVLAGIMLLYGLGKWIYYLIRFGTHKFRLLSSFVRTLILLGVVYIFFVLGWGANYYKPELKDYWKLGLNAKTVIDTASVVAFDRYLIEKINEEAPHFHSQSLAAVNKQAKSYYKTYTDCKDKPAGQSAKSSLYGFYMQYFGIQGYYNPFTGEAQVDDELPGYMLPFVVCHEMAHQTGIGNEGDANLLSYAVGTATNDTSFNYSCHFNIWLYAHNRLRRQDSALAKTLLQTLNPLTRAHIDTLNRLRDKYHSDVSRYSAELYDGYLRMHQQKEGIRGYGSVTASAYAWEKRRIVRRDSVIRIP